MTVMPYIAQRWQRPAGLRILMIAIVVGPPLVSIVLGLGASTGSIGIVVALAVLCAGAVAFALGADRLLILVLLTCPIGLEQVTSNKRSLLGSVGGWGVSSLRLALIIGAVTALLALRGLPGRLIAMEQVYILGLGWMVLTLSYSPDVLGGMRFISKMAVLLFAWLGFTWLTRIYGTERLWTLLLVTLGGTLAVDYALFLGGFGFLGSTGVSRFAGIAGAPSSGAVSLGVFAVAALYRRFTTGSRLALALYVASAPLIFLSVTRIALAAFLIGSFVLAVRLGRHVQAIVTVALVLVVAVSYAPLRQRMAPSARTTSWTSIFHSVQANGFSGVNTEGRNKLWAALWAEFKRSPIVGSGAGDSERVVGQLTSDGIVQAHSDYLALLVNGGLVALALWAVSLGGLWLRLLRIGGAATPAAAALTMYFVVAITDNSIEMYANVGVPIAALIGLAPTAARRIRANTASTMPALSGSAWGV
jgi:hypothetical protein